MLQGKAHAALISAPGSGQGKSMVTAALARLHRNAGRTVRVFKHGPDYLDPMVQAASPLDDRRARVPLALSQSRPRS